MTHIYRVAKVDKSKCVGCKRCERRCPTGAIKVKPAGDCKYVAPCQNTCPAGINVPGYVALAGKGDYEGAYRLIRRDNPFPSVAAESARILASPPVTAAVTMIRWRSAM